MLPIKGFSLKPSIAYTRFGSVSVRDVAIPAIPQTPVVLKQYVGGFLSLAYTQAIGSRCFIEPVIGLGPSFGQMDAKNAKFSYFGLSVPAQLNFGFRF
jgi:hypothetical protein